MWPEKPAEKDKKDPNNNNNNEQNSSDGDDDEDEDQKENAGAMNVNSPKNVGPTVTFCVGLPENHPPGQKLASAVEQNSGGVGPEQKTGGGTGGGPAKKKKKRKGRKGNNGNQVVTFQGGVASSGTGQPSVGPVQVIDQTNVSPTIQCPYPYPYQPSYGAQPQAQQMYVVSYNAAHPSASAGPTYYIPPSPYTYESYGGREMSPVRSTPLDSSFEMLSEENPHGCYIM